MDLEFFDVNMYAGARNRGSYKPVTDSESCRSMMNRKGIRRALVWHIAQFEYSVPEGNNMLSRFITDTDILTGCWTLLPPQTPELPDRKTFFRRMKDERIKALRAFPGEHKYILDRTAFGTFMDEISERKIPLILSLRFFGIGFPEIYSFLKEYPGITCILCDLGVWGQDRYTRPLLEQYPDLYLETSFLSAQDGVTEDLVSIYGPERLVFGSGFPEREPESAMLSLIHADMGRPEKEMIAFRNLERILGRVVL
jgi:hypothetical protein